MSQKVAVIMGSDSDLPIIKPALERLRAFGVETDVRIMSAHRTPHLAAEFAQNARASGYGVLIAAAGKAAHLAGVLAAHTTLPVVGIPVGASLGGLDALLSTVQMPPGVPVAAVGVDAADNAAILAAQILSLSDNDIAEKLADMKADIARKTELKNAELQKNLSHM